MILKPDKFISMGIKIRKFIPFTQPIITKSFNSYKNSR